jgi:hypothetical protein
VLRLARTLANAPFHPALGVLSAGVTYTIRPSRDRYILVGVLALGIALARLQGASPSLLSYAAGSVGLFAVHERLRQSFSATVALFAVILLFGATSLFWSMTQGPRPLESVAFAIAALALSIGCCEPWRLRRAVVGAAAAVAAPLLAHAVFSNAETPAAAPESGIAAVLFSSTHGFFALTPVVYVAFAGAVAWFLRNRRDAALALVAFAAMLATVVLWPTATNGPDAHRLTASLAVLAPGLAFVIDRALARPWLAIVPLVAGVAVWNYWLMIQYTVGTLPKDEPVSFAGMVREQMAVQTRSPYAYPFALPASAWFAWREGVPVERFEQLAFEPRLTAIDQAMDRRVERFLLDGWEPGAEASGPHWIRDPRASMVLPFDPPAGGAVDVAINARTRLEEPAMNATIALEVNGHEVGRFVVPPTAPADFSTRVPADAIGRVWRAGYNRLTFVNYGVQRVDPSDIRPPGPLGRRLKDRPWPVAIYRVRITPSP